MAFYSNGQSESPHAGGGGSSDCDSEEQRFQANVNPSQHQYSSSTTTSSSHSEQEEVCTLPSAEKPAALPSAKKNPNSSDRSAVRNQCTPSEPNPNKPKDGVAAKRTKDDAFAEEQPQQNKPSASKEKKPTEDDEREAEQKKKTASKRKKAAKEEVSVSNPSPAPVPKVTRPGKDSHQKKAARVWTKNDENVIMHYFLESAKKGLEFSKVFGKINNSLSRKASNPQLHNKVKNMRRRYRSLKTKMCQGGIKEDALAFKSPHEKKLYKLWNQAWGEQHEADEMEVGHTLEVGEDSLVYVPIMKEILDTVADVTREIKKIAETSEAELKALLGPN